MTVKASVCLALFLLPIFGQGVTAVQAPEPSAEIKRLLESQLRDRSLIGIAALVIRSNTIVGVAAAGVSRQEGGHALKSTDLFHLGSTTKAITATMIARLVEANKLSWTTTALEIFPELTQVMHPAFRHITLEQLLSHHAGVPSFDTFTVTLLKNTWPKPLPHLRGTEAQQRSDFAAWVLRRRPAVPPGTEALYSNADFAIAAAMAERRTKSRWEDLVTSQVLEPLGIHAIFGFPLSADRNEPWGHVEYKKRFVAVPGGVVELPSYLLPAGGMSMALADYARFLQMNLKGLRGEDSGFLSATTIARLHSSPMHDHYALGWGVSQINGVLSSTHSGSDGSFYALVALQPSRDTGVALVLNSSGERSRKAADELMKRLLAKYAVAKP